MRYILTLIVFFAASSGRPALAAAMSESTVPASIDYSVVDHRVTDFFALLKANKAAAATELLFKDSPLMAGKVAELQNVQAQLAASVQIYGPISSFEKVDEKALGSMFVRRQYVVQHEKFLTRFDFTFVKLKSGWTVGYFVFDDKVQQWD